jgi:hypothetical protein
MLIFRPSEGIDGGGGTGISNRFVNQLRAKVIQKGKSLAAPPIWGLLPFSPRYDLGGRVVARGVLLGGGGRV